MEDNRIRPVTPSPTKLKYDPNNKNNNDRQKKKKQQQKKLQETTENNSNAFDDFA